jgi:outer membrane protein assembly factor BamA
MKGCFLSRRGYVTVSGMKTIGFVLFFLLVSAVAPAVAQQGVIKEIVVFGNERVDKRIVLKEIGSKVGEPFSQERVREDSRLSTAWGTFATCRSM